MNLKTRKKGIYISYNYFDPEYIEGDYDTNIRSVKIIILDTRFHKTPYLSFDEPQDVLGAEQWKFLENELLESVDKNFTWTLIVSGTQILPVSRLISESWFSESRSKLFELIGKCKAKGVIFLTGDVHFAEISRSICVHPGKIFIYEKFLFTKNF